MTIPSTPSWEPQFPFKTPESMVAAIRDGRFAVDVALPGRGKHVIFLRVSRPTAGQYKDCIKIQTQHSEKLKLAVIRWPERGTRAAWWQMFQPERTRDIDAALRLIVVNPLDCAMLYAKELERCARCGVELTDERSRWYCIGPECEKHWPDFIIKVSEEKGVYAG